MLSVYAGYLDAGFVRESAMNTVEKYIPSNQLKIVMKTSWIPQWALSVSHGMPDDHVYKIRQALQQLPTDHPVLKAMKVDDLIPAMDSDYDVLRDAL